MPGLLGGLIHDYTTTFVPSPPPIKEAVRDFVDTFVPSGPPIIEGITRGDTISGFADAFQPSGPPIREGFTEGLHFIIDAFGQDNGGGLGDSGVTSDWWVI